MLIKLLIKSLFYPLITAFHYQLVIKIDKLKPDFIIFPTFSIKFHSFLNQQPIFLGIISLIFPLLGIISAISQNSRLLQCAVLSTILGFSAIHTLIAHTPLTPNYPQMWVIGVCFCLNCPQFLLIPLISLVVLIISSSNGGNYDLNLFISMVCKLFFIIKYWKNDGVLIIFYSIITSSQRKYSINLKIYAINPRNYRLIT